MTANRASPPITLAVATAADSISSVGLPTTALSSINTAEL
jgi:hypothetical protein